MKRIQVGVLLLCVAGLCGLLWYGFGKDPSIVSNPLVDHPAPLFALPSANHTMVRLDSFRGRPVVINFFASWCVSCKAQEANLVAAYDRWHSKVAFLGIIYQDEAPAATQFTRDHGGRWTDLVDHQSDTAINYGVTGVPETFFVNRKGEIVYHTVSLQPSALTTGIIKSMRT